jgi:hypothetical protein
VYRPQAARSSDGLTLSYASGVVPTGASVLTNGDPDVAGLVGLWACTGALVLTSVPDSPEVPPVVPLPVVLTGASVLINGDPDVPGLVAEPTLAPLDGPVAAGAEAWLPPPVAGATPLAGEPAVDWI